MRERICDGLQFLGINLDMVKNNKTEGVEAEISLVESKVKVLVIKTDEMEEMAKSAFAVLNS
jgi:acetate kinase